ncbi:patatin-like phospholipase family protein [uncultured Albimonas sp.]|uniref:patatin-like phospholipase family protein n=1 Tax=uncultured Albimonas sp. TaxID=1331701 RepID=UPI0030EF98EF|tara:strand:- start:2796 stop:3017 length:222 start_codon:yes stop_codon:yes gene_type:complete
MQDEGPEAILALDGGGVRGMGSVAFLERMETLLAAQGRERLSEAFDLLGGVSTGAILAGALAMGRSASEVREF